MPDRVQIGPKVDANLWKQLREDVKERKGTVRGNLGDELDNAIREYLRGEERPVDQRIEKRLSRIEQAVGAAPTDGGRDTFGGREHTHARTETTTATPTERPAANTSTDKKVAWLAKCVRENHGDDFAEVTRDDLREVVKDEYGFRRDTAKRYVENLIDHFELMTHPATDKVLVTEDRHERIIENRREGLHREAEEVLDMNGDTA